MTKPAAIAAAVAAPGRSGADAPPPVPAGTEPVTPRRDFIPLLLVPVLALLALPLVGSPSSWLTLTVAGLAMGMIIFIIASGLTLVFGLMDVLNLGHGVFLSLIHISEPTRPY